MDDYLIVPDTGEKITDGTVVVLYRLPNMRWIVHKGRYIYNGHTEEGWYVSSIPSQTNMPLYITDLCMIRIVDHGCNPYPHPPCPPCPPPPTPGPSPEVVPFTKEDKEAIAKAMLTVDTIEDRDALVSDELISGKVVRVNDVDGEPRYYEWNKTESRWDDIHIPEWIDL